MNRKFFIVLFFVLFCLVSSAVAQYEERSTVVVGVEYRHKTIDLKTARLDPAYMELDDTLRAMDIQIEYEMPMAYVQIAFMNYVEIKFFCGSMDVDMGLDSDVAGFSHAFKSDSEPIFGFGGKLFLPFKDKFSIGLYFEHLSGDFEDIELSSAQPTMSFTTETGIVIPIDSVAPDKMRYHETTITPVISAQLGKFMPYAGPRYTRITTDMDITYSVFGDEFERDLNYEIDEKWSFVLGCVAWFNANFSVSAEIEMLSNESYSVGLRYSF